MLGRSFPLPHDLPDDVGLPGHGVHRVAQVLRHQADVSVHYGHATDFYLPQERWVAILDAMVRTESLFEGVYLPNIPGGEMYHHLRLCRLLQTQLPELELSSRDVIAVREDDCFSIWRNQLGQALDRVLALRDQELIRPGAELQLIQEELLQSRRGLEKRVGTSGFLSQAQTGLTSFTAGGLAAISLSHWFNPVPSMLSGALAFLLKTAWELRNSRVSGSDLALLNHYAVFESPLR